MSTELATIETNNYLALQDGGAIAEAMEANLGEGSALKESDLTRVKIPTGGATKWTVSSILGDEVVDKIEGILVYQQPRGVLWSGSEPAEGELPVLVSNDLKTAKLVKNESDVDPRLLASMEVAKNEDGTYDWAKLPQNEWGSGKDGRGKQCKEQRVLFILRKQEPLPLIVTVQPGSLKSWNKFVVDLTKAGIPYWRAAISLGLEKEKNDSGIPFARITAELAGVLDADQAAVIREKFTEPMRQVASTSFAG